VQVHAPYTPAAACPVTRFPAGLSQEVDALLVSTTSLWITTSQQGFACARLLAPYLLGYFPNAFTPTLTTNGF